MAKFLLGQKLGMSQVYNAAGEIMPVTVLSVAPATVTQVRTKERDGYEAVQIGAGSKKKLTKPLAGHVKDLGNFRWLREFRIPAGEQKRGGTFDASVFTEGDVVHVTA